MKTGASRWVHGVLLGMGLLVAGSGCSICCAPFDYHYGAYGGAWERDDMQCGRVGSAFYPAGHPTKVRVLSKPVEPTPLDEPPPVVPAPDSPLPAEEISPTEPPLPPLPSTSGEGNSPDA